MSSALITDTFKQVKPGSIRQAKDLKKPAAVTQQKVQVKHDKSPRELEELDILRQFDLESDYGPCIGITRLERWERADRFGLSPPETVKKLIDEHSTDEKYTECVWHSYNI